MAIFPYSLAHLESILRYDSVKIFSLKQASQRAKQGWERGSSAARLGDGLHGSIGPCCCPLRIIPNNLSGMSVLGGRVSVFVLGAEWKRV